MRQALASGSACGNVGGSWVIHESRFSRRASDLPDGGKNLACQVFVVAFERPHKSPILFPRSDETAGQIPRLSVVIAARNLPPGKRLAAAQGDGCHPSSHRNRRTGNRTTRLPCASQRLHQEVK